ncbi:MAG: hypothetical protein BGO45_10805 [Microbacterium sp. 71-36]|uniref:HNH endonuclease signature motif containing protein n=1 Tax=unclassified Microbacterium TaxID=2609290 RepID=UPI000869551D|nr:MULTISPECIES: HNH endonuclease signature motif containing protein [unclassified Microbacterium]MBN9210756.1 HNH endonuclease [Microbacterium sp.]ODT40900.1 MAG: hypothetical protein ABS60_03830 [Microbacterium sp. SCN 71-17]OJV77277.1 MAG: hypothetical protein BGO45_10805 [Microbacterium sp. 71-36]
MKAPCAIDDCDRPSRARGWCTLHWDRYRRHGDPLHSVNHRAPASATVSERFWARVVKADCWEWTGSLRTGYGLFRLDGRNVQTHRWAYEEQVGPIPDGFQIDHLCRNTRCVNPDHLEPVTQAENIRREHAARAA